MPGPCSIKSNTALQNEAYFNFVSLRVHNLINSSDNRKTMETVAFVALRAQALETMSLSSAWLLLLNL